MSAITRLLHDIHTSSTNSSAKTTGSQEINDHKIPKTYCVFQLNVQSIHHMYIIRRVIKAVTNMPHTKYTEQKLV
jgi:hypothetical protein